MRLVWRGGADGALVISNDAEWHIADAEDLASFITAHGAHMPFPVLEVLGAIAVFMALRVFGVGSPGSVLYGTRKGLDSIWFSLSAKESNEAFEAGQEAIYEDLFPVRGSSFEEMVSHAFHYISRRVDEVRSVA